jgi:hypothetical protein
MGSFDKYLGIVLISVVLYYIFRDANGTVAILGELSKLNTRAIGALQGQQQVLG